MLQRLVEKQIELGRIVLTEEAAMASEAAARRGGVPAEATAVEEATQWLLAAHRCAGRSLQASPGITALPAVVEERQASQPVQGSCQIEEGEPNACRRSGNSPQPDLQAFCSTTCSEEYAMLEQMRGISRSLWSTLSSGTASGAVAFPASRAADDFAWRGEEVALMRASGELDARHHRKRDAQTRHREASARDAALRRGSSAHKAG